MHKGHEVEQQSIAICIHRMTESHMLPWLHCMQAVGGESIILRTHLHWNPGWKCWSVTICASEPAWEALIFPIFLGKHAPRHTLFASVLCGEVLTNLVRPCCPQASAVPCPCHLSYIVRWLYILKCYNHSPTQCEYAGMICSALWWQNSTRCSCKHEVSFPLHLVAFGGFCHVYVHIQKTSTSFCYLFLLWGRRYISFVWVDAIVDIRTMEFWCEDGFCLVASRHGQT